MKNKKQKTDQQYADELMIEWYGPEWGAGTQEKH